MTQLDLLVDKIFYQMGQTQSLEPQDGSTAPDDGASFGVKRAGLGNDAETRTKVNAKVADGEDGLSGVTTSKPQKQKTDDKVPLDASLPPSKILDKPSSVPTSNNFTNTSHGIDGKQRSTRSSNPRVSKIQPPQAKKNNWGFWRKNKRSKKSIVTTGLTMKVDEEHNMLLFIPEKHRAMQQKQERKGKSKKVVIDLGTYDSRKQGSGTTQLIMKDSFDVKETFSLKLKGRRDSPIDPSIVCGIQIFLTRCDPMDNLENLPCESAPNSDSKAKRGVLLPGGFEQIKTFGSLNVTRPNSISGEKLEELLQICKKQLGFDSAEKKSRDDKDANSAHGIGESEADLRYQPLSSRVYDLSGNSRKLSKVFSAIVPRGVGREIFTHEAVMNTAVPPGKFDVLSAHRILLLPLLKPSH